MHSMERVYLVILWKELICLIKVILYHPGQYGVFSDDTYHVCEDVYARFEMLVGNEEFPFRDEASIAFLKKRNCSFIEGDRYAIRDGNDINRVFPITYINRCEQEGLILISNSQRGIYTHTKHLDRLVINALKKLDIDILLTLSAIDGKSSKRSLVSGFLVELTFDNLTDSSFIKSISIIASLLLLRFFFKNVFANIFLSQITPASNHSL